jgi:hypothetical protein
VTPAVIKSGYSLWAVAGHRVSSILTRTVAAWSVGPDPASTLIFTLTLID